MIGFSRVVFHEKLSKKGITRFNFDYSGYCNYDNDIAEFCVDE